MVSLETRARIFKIFLCLIDYEKSVEILRSILNKQNDFDPLLIFSRLDQNQKTYLDEIDFKTFLRLHSIYVTDRDLLNMISFYDINQDRKLNYLEFCNLILSNFEINYRKYQPNDSFGQVNYNQGEVLDFELEYSLSKVIEKEVELAKTFDNLVRELSTRKDFLPYEIYSMIDEVGMNHITKENLKAFFKQGGLTVQDSDLTALFKRMDIDKDGRVTFWEFKSLITFKNYSNISALVNQSLNNNVDSFDNSKYIKTGTSQVQIKQVQTERENNYQVTSGSRAPNLSKCNSSNLETKYKIDSEDITFIDFTKDVINQIEDLEKVRCSLSLKNDFSLIDMYLLFENKTSSGYISIDDFKVGLNLFEVYPSNEEIKLWVFSLTGGTGTRGIKYSQFSQLFLPFDKQHSYFLQKRPSFNFKSYTTLHIFSAETKLEINKLFTLINLLEVRFERWCQKIEKSMNLNEFFNKLSKNDILQFEDLAKFFKFHRVTLPKSRLEAFFFYLDKEKIGKITKDQFVTLLSPKSSEVYII